MEPSEVLDTVLSRLSRIESVNSGRVGGSLAAAAAAFAEMRSTPDALTILRTNSEASACFGSAVLPNKSPVASPPAASHISRSVRPSSANVATETASSMAQDSANTCINPPGKGVASDDAAGVNAEDELRRLEMSSTDRQAY